LYRYLREADPKHFQPMNANYGLVDDLPNPPRDKMERKQAMADRALRDQATWIDEMSLVGLTV
jgi:methylenetetrahydrofolate--tRNA-(uracil-5-)-methyltransferase